MRILAFFANLACLSTASLASTLPFTGSLSYTVGAGSRCNYNTLADDDEPYFLGCTPLNDGWDMLINFDQTTASVDRDWLNIDLGLSDITRTWTTSSYAQGSVIPDHFRFNMVTGGGGVYDKHILGGNQVEYRFGPTSGNLEYWDDDFIFGVIKRPISDVALTVEFAPLASAADPLPTPVPASLPLVLGGMALRAAAGRRRNAHSD